MKLGNSVADSI